MQTQEDTQCQANVLTASLPTSLATPESASVATVAVNGRMTTTLTTTPTPAANRATAGIKRGLALQYLYDLAEWRNGDPARFNRMVDNGGKAIGSPEGWLRNLGSICANVTVVAVYPELPAQVAAQLAGMGLQFPTNSS